MSAPMVTGSPIRLTPNLRLVLARLHRTQRPMYAYEVASDLSLEMNAVLGSFHRLETAGYLSRVDEPDNAPRQEQGRPRVWFELTEEGREFAAATVEDTHRIARNQALSIGLNGLDLT